MKKVNLVINDQLYATLGLTNTADEAQIGAAFQAMATKAALADQLQNTVTTLTTEKTNLQIKVDKLEGEATQAEITNMLAASLTNKCITKEQHDAFAKDYVGKPTELKNLLSTFKPHRSINERLNDAGNENDEDVKDLVNMSWDDLDKGDHLATLKQKAPSLYNSKYKQKFGREPKQD